MRSAFGQVSRLTSVGKGFLVTRVVGWDGWRESTNLAGSFPSCNAIGHRRPRLTFVQVSFNCICARWYDDTNVQWWLCYSDWSQRLLAGNVPCLWDVSPQGTYITFWNTWSRTVGRWLYARGRGSAMVRPSHQRRSVNMWRSGCWWPDSRASFVNRFGMTMMNWITVVVSGRGRALRLSTATSFKAPLGGKSFRWRFLLGPSLHMVHSRQSCTAV